MLTADNDVSRQVLTPCGAWFIEGPMSTTMAKASYQIEIRIKHKPDCTRKKERRKEVLHVLGFFYQVARYTDTYRRD